MKLVEGQIIRWLDPTKKGKKQKKVLGRILRLREDGYVDWVEFGGCGAIRVAKPEDLEIQRRDKVQKDGLTKEGQAEARYDVNIDGHAPLIKALSRREIKSKRRTET